MEIGGGDRGQAIPPSASIRRPARIQPWDRRTPPCPGGQRGGTTCRSVPCVYNAEPPRISATTSSTASMTAWGRSHWIACRLFGTMRRTPRDESAASRSCPCAQTRSAAVDLHQPLRLGEEVHGGVGLHHESSPPRPRPTSPSPVRSPRRPPRPAPSARPCRRPGRWRRRGCRRRERAVRRCVRRRGPSRFRG